MPSIAPLLVACLALVPPAAAAGGVGFVPTGSDGAGTTAFELRGSGGAFAFTPQGWVMALPAAAVELPPDAGARPPTAPLARLRLRFDRPQTRAIEGERPLAGRISRLAGEDPRFWRRGLTHYAKLVYRDLFPGIDLVFERRPEGLKATFELAPGADSRRLRWFYDGLDAAAIEPGSGALRLSLAGAARELTESAPVAWQEEGGEQRAIAARYRLSSARPGEVAVAIELGDYDRSLPLTVDPTLFWSSFLGGGSYDLARGLAADAGGFAVTVGSTLSVDFPVQDPYQVDFAGWDVFVAKLDPLAAPSEQLVYATYLAGGGTDWAEEVAVDSLGRIAIAGYTDSRNAGSAFPTRNGYASCVSGVANDENAFVAVLTAAGDDLAYGTCLSGALQDRAVALALGPGGGIWLTGWSDSSDFPLRGLAPSSPFQSDQPGPDAFLARLDPNAIGDASLLFSTYLGGDDLDWGFGVAVEASGRATVVGLTESTDFPTTAGAVNTTRRGVGDAFASRFEANGDALVYSTLLGGGGYEQAWAVAVDGLGAAYIGGYTDSTDFPLAPPGGHFQGNQPALDAFLTKLAPNGGGYLYSTYYGGGALEEIRALALDDGRLWFAGLSSSSDLPLAEPVQAQRAGGVDAFVGGLDRDGRTLLFASYLGGGQNDVAWGVARDAVGTLYVAGQTQSADFPTVNAFASSCASCGGPLPLDDAFVAGLAWNRLFADGFESGGTARWSARLP